MNDVLSWARAVLETTPERWTNLAETIPVELLTYEPAEGEWGALGCLQHLLDTERMVFPLRVVCFLKGQDFPAFNPDVEGSIGDKPVDIRQLVGEFSRMRAESLSLLSGLNPADLARTAYHSELGEVSLSEMLHEWAAHDLMHTVQAERAMMQPFIAGSGPWKVYFTDHIA